MLRFGKGFLFSKIIEKRNLRDEQGAAYKAGNWPVQKENEEDKAFNKRILAFNVEVTHHKSLNLKDHDAAMQAVLFEALPYKILQKQKRYMRHHMRKPHGMKVRTYAAHLTKISCEELPE